ncbi:lipid-binding SYLF domain-containing protein [Nitratifractor sp.]
MGKVKTLAMTASLVLGASVLQADLNGLMSSVGDFAKGVGQKVGKAVEDIGRSAGVGLSATEIESRAQRALERLYNVSPKAKELAGKAKAILVFPEVLKAGVGIGGSYGEGVLLRDGHPAGFYSIAAGSYGLQQLGAQSYGYAMFFMDEESLKYLLEHNQGWEVGTGPSIVLVDKGMASTTSNTTLSAKVYVFTFGQKGLMAGSGFQGSKISRIVPEK